MNRMFLSLFACASLIALSLPVGGSLRAQESVPSLAVLPLQGNNVYRERTKMLGHRLRKILALKHNLPQVDYELVDSGNTFECQNIQCAAEKGRLLRVDQVIYGQIRNQQNTYSLQLTLVDTQTRKKIRERSESCNYCDFTQVLKSLAPTLLDSMELAKAEREASNISTLLQWKNHVGNGLTFDYPNELEVKERVHSHRSGSYSYTLGPKDRSLFFVSVMVVKKPDSSYINLLDMLKDYFREDNILNESKKVNYSLGNKQVDGIPYVSKSNNGDGLFMLFEGNINAYQIDFQTFGDIDANNKRVLQEFLKLFLKTLYVE